MNLPYKNLSSIHMMINIKSHGFDIYRMDKKNILEFIKVQHTFQCCLKIYLQEYYPEYAFSQPLISNEYRAINGFLSSNNQKEVTDDLPF